MAEHIILAKVTDALIALLTAANVGANVVDGKNSAEKTAPYVGCEAANAEEDPMGSGNFMVDAMVTVKYIAAVDSDGVDPKPAADTLSANVFAVLETDTLAADLSAAIANFTVFGFMEGKQVSSEEDGDCWVETWRRKIYCAGSSF